MIRGGQPDKRADP
jgi:hypothetical protein